MFRFLADHNVNDNLVFALHARVPEVDVVRVRDVGLSRTDDRSILDWAAREGRLVLTLDRRTMSRCAFERLKADQPMPGVFQLRPGFTLREVIEDLVLIVSCCDAGEFDGQVRYIPLDL